jgi:hypothetical protein
MTTKEINSTVEEPKKIMQTVSSWLNPLSNINNPWYLSEQDVDKYDYNNLDYNKLIRDCRFFYKRDPISSTTINKMVDIGITEILFTNKGKLTENELRIFYGIKDSLQAFAENMAIEFLISGLVIPEIEYAVANKDELEKLGIKKYSSLILPVSMWVRDPSTIKINSTYFSDKPSYFIKIPEKLIYFITNNGKYPDGTSDEKLLSKFKVLYPEFISEILSGKKEILLDNPLIFRSKYLSNSPYPIPYLSSALESLKHKRNLRRMDYSIASRVISAILLFRLGDKDFPLTEDDQEQFNAIKEQMLWRENIGKNAEIERIFQLFANHTLQIDWIYPPVDSLLNSEKYKDINQDIVYSLGFPRILITGETEKTGTSDPEFASLSPLKTMESMRRKILPVLRDVIRNVAERNNISYIPDIKFKNINLNDFKTFVTAIGSLYESGNLSRNSYAEVFGYDWNDEIRTKAEENNLLKELNVEEFAPKPYSPQPKNQQTSTKKRNNSDKLDQ